MRFKGAPRMLGVLNHSSRCMLVLGSMQCANVNLLCCLAAPRLVGAGSVVFWDSLNLSLQYTGKLSHAGVLWLSVLLLQW